MFEHIEKQKVDGSLIKMIKEFRRRHPMPEGGDSRLVTPKFHYYGKAVLEQTISALLEGENLLLCGPKATGKNVLAEQLAYYFGRPVYNVSFHVNTDSAALIGTDTFVDGGVTLRKGPIYLCAELGGFGVLDELNMAKNEAAAVLHATLDYRRMIDVPGYSRIDVHPACRFIGTMNYGYAGTRELNEALVSRFLVVDMPAPDEETLTQVLNDAFPEMNAGAVRQFVSLFQDLQTKADNGEISTKSLDLRGLISALKTVRIGITPLNAVRMGMVNKSFDAFEREIIEDAVRLRIPAQWTGKDVF